jgi:RNA polymerase II subunit A C-terminal domain phosphatase SSU72
MSDPRLATRGDPRLASTTPTQAPPPPPPPGDPNPEERPSGIGAGPDNSAEQRGEQRGEDGKFKLRFCTVCAMNQNRSMEAHLRLSLASYPVISFGTGSLVRLPGPSITQPNIYPFNTISYENMFTELSTKDPRLYRANGLLNMLERNKGIKLTPERFQDWGPGIPRVGEKYAANRGSAGTEGGVVDVIITCEERCWDAVVENLLERGSPLNRPVHVINVDIKDNHEEASIGGRAIVDLADSLNAVAREEREKSGEHGWEVQGESRRGFDARVPDIVADWQERWPNLPALWTLGWF